MGLFDDISGALKGLVGQGDDASVPSMISAALGKTDLGSLQGVVSKLQAGGLGDQVKSWLGDGSNLPVTADQIRAALGDEHVQQIAHQFGLPIDGALKLLSEHLPTAVDNASPGGSLPS